jgi:FkbM family methyltransferase
VSKLMSSAQGLIARGLSTLPLRYARQIEHASGLAQGKGWGGGTVEQEVKAAISLLAPTARQSPVVLDVGANIGEWSAALLNTAPNATVYAFEPSSAAFKQLATRFSSDGRLDTINAAVSDEIGTAELWSDTPGSGLASLSKRRLDHFNIDFNYSEEVPVLTLDSWSSDNAVHAVLLKMDVEGHELAVLHGAKETLREVQVVQFEFGGCNIDSRTYFQDFFYFFQEAGFRLLRLGPKGLDPVSFYSEHDEVFTTTNYFAQRI